MQKRKHWQALLLIALIEGCRYGYELLPLPEDRSHAGTGGEASIAGAAVGGADGDATAGADTEPTAGSGGMGGSDGSGESGAAGETGGSGATGGLGGSTTGGLGGLGGSGATGGLGGLGGSGAVSGAGAGGGGSGVPPDPALCNQGQYGGHDYLLCKEPRNWADANSGCQAVGMRLVRVDDANENQWLFDNAITPGGSNSLVWLGATDQAVEGEWRWTDGELFWLGIDSGSAQNGLFAGWYFREPNNVNGEHCGSLETNSASPSWFDTRCHLTTAFICETP
jgi:hypothetical protein